MKKTFALTILVLALAVLAGVALAWLDRRESAAPQAPQASASVSSEPKSAPASSAGSSSEAPLPSSAVPPGAYLLTEYEGKLAVMRPGAEEPERVYDVYIRTLPEYDRRRLEEGIWAADEAALQSLLQDYLS